MSPTLTTERLTLRPLVAGDAPDIASRIAEWEVIRWLSRPPHPYRLADAEAFLDGGRDRAEFAITHRGALIGVIASRDEVGYWLARPAWGRGFASEAARRVVDWRFAEGADLLESSHYLGNEASRRVLEKAGFRDAGPKRIASTPLGREVDACRMRITRAEWEAARGLPIRTERLTLDLMREDDAEALHATVTIPEVGRNLMVFPPWWTVDAARAFIAEWSDLGALRYRLAIRRGGRMIGSVGFFRRGGPPPLLFYWLHPDAQGRGYATEAVRAACLDFFRRAPWADRLVAGVFADNPASARVLDKLGAVRTGERACRSDARMDPHPMWDYRLDRTALEAAA
ncbi:MAG: GNAT family N-acetyltransferase [Hasllibacter sp.]